MLHEESVIEMYYYIAKEAFGETFLSAQVNRIGEQITGIKALNPPKLRNQFDARFYFIAESLQFYYEKIDFFFMTYPYLPPETEQLYNLFFILSFSPNYHFRFFMRIHHRQGTQVDDIFFNLHQKLMAVLIEKLDPNNEKSYTYRLQHAEESKRPELEKALCVMINEVRKL